MFLIMRGNEVTVVGAGPVGCVMALYLSRAGHPVAVYERRPDPRVVTPEAGRSVALVLSARGWQALRNVGLEEEVRAISRRLSGRAVHFRDGKAGFHPYGAAGQAIFCVSRPTLNNILVSALEKEPGVRISFETRCDGLDSRTGELRLTSATTNETRAVPAVRVLASDGAFSRVRQSWLRNERFDYRQRYLAHGYKELLIPPTAEGHWAMDPGSTHVWPRGSHMLVAFPGEGRTFTATMIMPYEGPTSFALLDTPEAVRAFFEAHYADVLGIIPDLPQLFLSRKTWPLFSIQCAPWTRDGVGLIGDAAHAVVPFFVQGMNAGFEDCEVLAGILTREPNWQRALKQYEEERRPNCDALTELSLRHFHELSSAVGDPLFAVRKHLEQKVGRMFPDRFVPLYTRVAFTTLPYAEAMRVSDEQNALLEGLMAIPGIAEKWDSPEVEGAIRRAMETFQGTRPQDQEAAA
jgi:kynurenine 3-monooxygenase